MPGAQHCSHTTRRRVPYNPVQDLDTVFIATNVRPTKRGAKRNPSRALVSGRTCGLRELLQAYCKLRAVVCMWCLRCDLRLWRALFVLHMPSSCAECM